MILGQLVMLIRSSNVFGQIRLGFSQSRMGSSFGCIQVKILSVGLVMKLSGWIFFEVVGFDLNNV
jgi:hypothetical protein